MNLKQKLTQTLTQKKADSDLLSQISTLKSKLASQKSFNSAGYNKLSEIEHSLYRYNTFITGNLTKEADREAQRLSGMVKNLNDENIVLEGGINNSKYVWHTEPNACKECQELDGTIYYTKEDIPEKPHPNCKCSIEEIPMDEETCDCSKFIQQIDEMLNQIDKLREIISIRSSNLLEILSYDLSIRLENWGHSILEKFAQYDNFLGDLTSSFVESRENIYENSDKYYHMKAYCKVGQREDEIAGKIAIGVGQFRELFQGVMSLITEEKSLTEAIQEYTEDTNANNQGYNLGKQIPEADCDVIINRVFPYKIWKEN